MYALSISVDDDLLQRIKEAKTPKEAWDTIAGLFTRMNDAKLQQLENQLLSIKKEEKSLFNNKRGKDWKAVRTNNGGKPKQVG